ncbi:hypothetical protein GQ54DRAFT_197151 [Martensiomyces pterosporus]|nr:hypothetical protein GQ54DRAFT_197151 [Martensiomyces pterosporus]
MVAPLPAIICVYPQPWLSGIGGAAIVLTHIGQIIVPCKSISACPTCIHKHISFSPTHHQAQTPCLALRFFFLKRPSPLAFTRLTPSCSSFASPMHTGNRLMSILPSPSSEFRSALPWILCFLANLGHLYSNLLRSQLLKIDICLESKVWLLLVDKKTK